MIKDLNYTFNIDVPAEAIQAVIILMLSRADKNFPIVRKTILSNLNNYMCYNGLVSLKIEEVRKRLGDSEKFKMFLERSSKIFYREFPELIEEENTIKMIKSL